MKKGMLPPLETFACPYPSTQSRSGVIRIVFPEFTCVCPKTGYPDFASITLLYLPSTLCLELKSWKLYLNAFRMIGTFHETFCSHIYRELCTILNPQWLLLLGSFLPRGNVETVVLFESETPRPTGVDILLPRTVPNCSSLQPND
ncbi:MAG: preQ(1) synthase [Chitinivibrionales bacterium]|nr:preQ(1) synthase [Chitinivibrionales bacterium]